MTTNESPHKYENWLREALSNDKMPLAFLLGAGCPMAIKKDGAPLILDIAGLTRKVGDVFRAGDLAGPYATIIDHYTKDHGLEPTVEELLTFCRGLRSVVGTGSVRDLTGKELAALDERTCEVVLQEVEKVLPAGTPYHRIAAWAGAIQRVKPVEFFTTNYDLLLEQAFEAQRVPYFDGFVGSYQSFFDPHSIEGDHLPARWARLWKIHGSINWHYEKGLSVYRGSTKPTGADCVIHPSHLKYEESRRMPYVALMDRLRSYLRQPNAFLVACGFSFRDQHINEIVLEALRGNPTATVFALFRRPIDECGEVVDAALKQSNLTMLAANGAVVGARRITWAPGQPAGAESEKFQLGDFAQFGSFILDFACPIRPIARIKQETCAFAPRRAATRFIHGVQRGARPTAPIGQPISGRCDPQWSPHASNVS